MSIIRGIIKGMLSIILVISTPLWFILGIVFILLSLIPILVGLAFYDTSGTAEAFIDMVQEGGLAVMIFIFSAGILLNLLVYPEIIIKLELNENGDYLELADTLLKFIKYPERILYKYGEYFESDELCMFQNLSEEFMIDFAEDLDWKMISRHQKMSKDFIIKHMPRLDTVELLRNTKIKKIIKHDNELNLLLKLQ